ncbi:hypothetical protein Zmor_019475 [Zophobas morio]|uniref:Poly [ADP-ribose] polymerase n=1 Tax=Zophobas morio TaxID=2755281 RepID=A0AA38I094_9CUCU|nr:hypothetical protein Zmor_019475 [Zophobas morio]
MGIFSSKEEPPQPTPNFNYESSYRVQPQRTYYHDQFAEPTRNFIYESSPIRTPSYNRVQPASTRDDFAGATRRLQSLQISQPSRRIEGPKRSSRNQLLVDSPRIVTYVQLEPYHPEYLQVTRMITNKKNFKVDSIEKIENPYLEKAFELKKHQKETQFVGVEERLLFHGTKRANVDAICRMNFNWRRCQTHKYGKGVSFSPNSTYASVYSDEGLFNKVMIVAKVLIGNSCIGDKGMVVPPEGFDTSQKGFDGIVIVKFEDNEFCPVYKIKYHVRDESVGKGPGFKKKQAKRGRQNLSGGMSFFDDLYDVSYLD